jgi:uncharacterized protein with HEPN domain
MRYSSIARSSSRREDDVRLRHILDAAREITQAVKGRSRADLDGDHLWALGLTKALEIIGEAASRLSDESRVAMPEVPWDEIVAMRNRLVHVYFDIDMDQVWSTCVHDIYPLMNTVKRALHEG